MIPSDHFVRFYNEVFKFLDERGGLEGYYKEISRMLREAADTIESLRKQVAKCQLPMLFIHGDSDDFVPTEMVHRLYAAKSGTKRLWLAPGSEHAMSYCDHPGEYKSQVVSFLSVAGF